MFIEEHSRMSVEDIFVEGSRLVLFLAERFSGLTEEKDVLL